MSVQPGARGEASLVVGESDTAVAIGSGDVSVLGTPRLVALFEAATVNALRGLLGADQTSVGTRVEIDHLRPSPIGVEVRATATLLEIDGRRLSFELEAVQDGVVVGRGLVTRAIVDRETFAALIDGR